MSSSELDLSGQLAVVTGGAFGIGGASVLALARQGADIVIADVDEAESQRTAEKVRALGRKALFIKTDVMDKAQIAKMVEKAAQDFGRIDILVNNAGGVRPRDFMDQNERNWQRVIDINMGSMLAATQAVARVMIAGKRGGAIVNVASSEGLRAAPGYSVYAACKAAMISFTKTSAIELGGHGIRVNCIAPDLIVTPGAPFGHKPEDYHVITQASALGRLGTAEEAGKVVLFLASPLASFVTGTTVSVDGGLIAAAGWTRSKEGVWDQYHIDYVGLA